jgi:uncharacterized membrane protein
LENAVKLIHVLAAIAWVGGGAVRQVLFAQVRSSADDQRLLNYLKEDLFLGRTFFNIAGILTLVAGIWLVLITPWEFSEAWISIGFVGVAAGVVLGAVMYPKLLRPSVEALEAGSNHTDAAVTGPVGRLVNLTRIEMVVLLIVVWAMVFKPGA